MNNPENLLYATSHEWAKIDASEATIGLTDHAQDALGDLVFVNLPEVGDTVVAGEAFGDVESVKAVSDIISPVSGIVKAVNEELLDAPETINADPYGAWLIQVEAVSGQSDLLDAAGYQAHCDAEG